MTKREKIVFSWIIQQCRCISDHVESQNFGLAKIRAKGLSSEMELFATKNNINDSHIVFASNPND